MSFADNAPALLERTFKGARTGRVLLWTTPLARRANRAIRKDQAAWNEFPLPAGNNWSFLVLMNQTVPYLAGTSGEQLNFEAGENVLPGAGAGSPVPELPHHRSGREEHPVAHSHDPERIPGDPRSPDAGPVDRDGQGPRRPPDPARLFAQCPPGESKLKPLDPAELDTIFGKDGYALAGDAKTLQKAVDQIRVGNELFPWIMILIMIIVTLENLLANTFYKESPRPSPAGAAA